MPNSTLASIVDTNNWDTVVAITYEDVNRAILADPDASPASFTQTSGGSSATGSFGKWSLTTGGAGPLLKLAIPVTGGTINANYYSIRNTTPVGLEITGTPTVTSLSYGDFELDAEGGTTMTVAGTVITAWVTVSPR